MGQEAVEAREGAMELWREYATAECQQEGTTELWREGAAGEASLPLSLRSDVWLGRWRGTAKEGLRCCAARAPADSDGCGRAAAGSSGSGRGIFVFF